MSDKLQKILEQLSEDEQEQLYALLYEKVGKRYEPRYKLPPEQLRMLEEQAAAYDSGEMKGTPLEEYLAELKVMEKGAAAYERGETEAISWEDLKIKLAEDRENIRKKRP